MDNCVRKKRFELVNPAFPREEPLVREIELAANNDLTSCLLKRDKINN
jgi:hypothetical protein